MASALWKLFGEGKFEKVMHVAQGEVEYYMTFENF